MGLRTALLLTAVVLISNTNGNPSKRGDATPGAALIKEAIMRQANNKATRAIPKIDDARRGSSLFMDAIQKQTNNMKTRGMKTRVDGDGTLSMNVINYQAANLANQDADATRGPPCDILFSWIYVRPGSTMSFRSQFLGSNMNFPHICGWSFWTEDDHELIISCDFISIRASDYLSAYNFDTSDELAGWTDVEIDDFEIDEGCSGLAFGLESTQVRRGRSFMCEVTSSPTAP